MQETYFQRLVNTEMVNIKEAVLAVPLDDPLKGAVALARLQGRAAGLKKALELAMQASRQDELAEVA